MPMGQPGGGGNTEQKINNLSADQTRPPPTKRVQERQALPDKGRKTQNNKHISNHVIDTQGSNFKNVLRKTLVTKEKWGGNKKIKRRLRQTASRNQLSELPISVSVHGNFRQVYK